MNTTHKHGRLVNDSQAGLVCTCTAAAVDDDSATPASFLYVPTVAVDRDTAPTASGSWLYVCSKCGATAWSGC